MSKKNLLLASVMSLFVLGGCNCPWCTKKEEPSKAQAAPAEQTAVKSLTAATFDESVKSEKLTVVKFWASWCTPCRQMAPVYEKVATELKDTVNFYQVNVDEETALAEKYEVKGVPTILFFKDGKKSDAKLTKAVTEEELKEEITKAK